MFHDGLAMQIEAWLQDRNTTGTVADLAKRMVGAGKRYAGLESRLRQCYVLEALMRHGGDQTRTADALGVTRHTIRRIVRSLGVRSADLRALAKEIGGK